MAFELEALVGHLYIAGGRTINTSPPGALVEVAPQKAARGRETDTFFVLVVPSGETAPTSFYQQMALMAAERFFKTGGSVTSALRDVFNTLNNNLFEHNHSGRKHYEAAMVCAVLRGEDLYLARAGAALSLLRYSGETLTLPENMADEESVYTPPLGVQPIPDVQMKRHTIDSGSRLLLADSSLTEITAERINQALAAGDITQVLRDLQALISRQIRMMAVEFVPAEDSVKMPVAEGESTTDIAAELAAARSKAQQMQIMAAAQEQEAAERRARRSRSEKMRDQNRQRAGKAVRSAGNSLNALSELSGKLFARPINVDEDKQERPRLSARFITFAIFLLPVTIVAVVLLSWLTNMGSTRFEQCVQETISAANTARSMDSSNPQGVLVAWTNVVQIADRCNNIREADPTVNTLRTEAQSAIDGVNDIRRREAVLLATMPENAQLTKLLIQGLTLYALDSANSLVYQISIGSSGMAVASLPQPIPSMRQGTTVDGIPIGQIFDIAYDSTEDAIVALDKQGTLIRCLPRFILECNAQRIPGSETLGNPTRISMWQRRLYVLDTGIGQIWRYVPSGLSYGSAPEEYFVGAASPNLTQTVDFEINSDGAIYILDANGVMRAYFNGTPQQAFSFEDFPQGESLIDIGAKSMYLNDSPIRPAFYFINQSTRTIYESTRAGTFMGRYRIFDEDKFAQLNDVVIEPGQNILYAASGNAIFAVRLQE